MDNHTTEICYIYGLRDKSDTRYFYVGSTKKLPAQRLREHLDYIRLGYNKNRHLVHKVNKVGVENVVIDALETCTPIDRFDLEYLWLNRLAAEGHPLTNIVKAPIWLAAEAQWDEYELNLVHANNILIAYLEGFPRTEDAMYNKLCDVLEQTSKTIIEKHFDEFEKEVQVLLSDEHEATYYKAEEVRQRIFRVRHERQ